MKEPSLGRGLGALIPKSRSVKNVREPDSRDLRHQENQYNSEAVINISTELIDANPFQPRQSFEYQALEELIASIKVHGIIQPLIVTSVKNGRYELVAGERRLRSAKTLKLKTVPVIVRSASEQSKLEMALIENIQRKDLNPMEQAEAYQALVGEFGLTQEEVAKRVGKNRATVANILRLVNLPAEIQKSLRDGKISLSHAKLILSAVEPSQQLKIWKTILKQDLSVRGGEELTRKIKTNKTNRRSNDPELREVEDALREALQTRVKISRRGEQGTINIYFYSHDELKNIFTKISN
ncbi:MAG: ParB/RepB/Spo0J family partition protein [bacterium]